jgi:hypothetical protein
MTVKFLRGSVALLFFGALLSTGAAVCRAQYDSSSPYNTNTGGPPTPQEIPGKAPAPAPAVNKAEEDAYKALSARTAGPAAQIQLADDFVKKFPDSLYLASVYGILTTAYFGTGDEDKMFVAGNKALELNPDNVDVLSLLAMAMPRRIRSTTPDAAQQMVKAEEYARHAIELIPNLPKPPDVDDTAFEKAKNEKLSMSHSGLGLIDSNHAKWDDARTELMLAVQLAATPDPVDYYLLGRADMNASYFNDAVTAFGKCAASGPLAAQCKTLGDTAQHRAATELSK